MMAVPFTPGSIPTAGKDAAENKLGRSWLQAVKVHSGLGARDLEPEPCWVSGLGVRSSD